MKKSILLVPALLLALAACTPTEQGAAFGGASGAAIGALASGNKVEGAIVGGAIGTVAGALIGRASENSNRCIYRDEYGRRYEAACPRGY
ncbi:YMGG-like glycine zipper-containing protein [Nitratireductor sp. ZSWI3]|uniref:YMGG-like glycine zipper-containing protein n=1 Tax=Nitratireductor sp. ZSWI3 TaxID=2966359 RepID=UPI00214F89FB|nr:YMGG-like glycine zipper-containing protein [Nitratireductor sp. ZSWI3]MCR4268624.1 YMGG-like glycine zipper-containing protein [Nitratireductor sp. ZSWI3]